MRERSLSTGFGTHLRAHLPLFQALPQFEFIYVSPTARLFQAAESEFHHALYGQRRSAKSVNILEYFRLRRAWDARERVTSADVVLLKETQAQYTSKQTEDLYEKWRNGAATNDEVMRHADRRGELVKGVFRTLICGSSLKVFSDPMRGDAEIHLENNDPRDAGQFSRASSVPVSGS